MGETESTSFYFRGSEPDSCLGPIEEALVKERRDEGDDGHAHQRADAEDVLDRGEVVQEDLEERDHEQAESRQRAECRKMLDRMRGETHAVKNQYTGGTKRLRQHPVALQSVGQQPADQESAACHKSDGDAQRDGNQIVLEGILHEEDHAEEHRHPTELGEEFHAHEFFLQKRLLRLNGFR